MGMLGRLNGVVPTFIGGMDAGARRMLDRAMPDPPLPAIRALAQLLLSAKAILLGRLQRQARSSGTPDIRGHNSHGPRATHQARPDSMAARSSALGKSQARQQKPSGGRHLLEHQREPPAARARDPGPSMF